MEDDKIFIDNLVKNTIKNYKEKPHTYWNEMEMYMEQKGIVSKSFKVLNLRNVKTDIAVISGVIIITAGIYFSQNGNKKQANPKGIIENISDTAAIQKNTESVININDRKSEKDSSSDKVLKIIDENESKTVKVKIEIPVHKNVIIKKQVIIKDTVNLN